jgi:hypothetical protein
LACGIVPQEQYRSFGEGPLEVGVADLLTPSSIAFTSGLFRTFDETAIGDEFLHAGEAADIMDFVEQHEGQDLADPWDRAQALEGLHIVLFGGLHDRPLKVREQAVVVVDQREVHLDALLDGGIRKALRHTNSVRFVGQLLADLG